MDLPSCIALSVLMICLTTIIVAAIIKATFNRSMEGLMSDEKKQLLEEIHSDS